MKWIANLRLNKLSLESIVSKSCWTRWYPQTFNFGRNWIPKRIQSDQSNEVFSLKARLKEISNFDWNVWHVLFKNILGLHFGWWKPIQSEEEKKANVHLKFEANSIQTRWNNWKPWQPLFDQQTVNLWRN